jgi:hypothetical protein
MSTTIVGLLEADLPGAIEYKEGGFGSLFATARAEEQIALYEFLERSLAALQRLGVTDVVSCYIDEVELFRDDDPGEESDFDIVLRAAKDVTEDESGVSFYLMLAHHDEQLSHIITFEGSVDHPADQAALSVLDTARLADADNRASDAAAPLAPVDDDVTFFDDKAADAEDLVDEFMQKVLAALEKELGVTEPEIDVWTDWEGVYTLESQGPSALPGITG